MVWWDPQKMMAMSLYLQGKRPHEIVQDLTVSEQTVRKWIKHPKFQLAVQQHQKDILTQVKAREVGYLNEAIDIVAQTMRHGTSRDRTKLAAAKMILDRAAPVIIEREEKQTSQSVKVLIVNGNGQGLPEGRRQELLDFESSMGYDKVAPPTLKRIETAKDVTPEDD